MGSRFMFISTNKSLCPCAKPLTHKRTPLLPCRVHVVPFSFVPLFHSVSLKRPKILVFFYPIKNSVLFLQHELTALFFGSSLFKLHIEQSMISVWMLLKVLTLTSDHFLKTCGQRERNMVSLKKKNQAQAQIYHYYFTSFCSEIKLAFKQVI